MANLNKEFWTDILLEGFYPDNTFLSQARDMSALVDNNTIHLAEAGVNPAVLVDNNVFPIATNSRVDNPLALALQTLDTENTVVRNIEEIETAYDKASSVAYGHRMALMAKAAALAAHNYTPGTNSAYTPILQATGPVNAFGVKALQFEDVLTLMVKYNALDLPGGRSLVFSPQHEADLIAQDLKLYKAVLASGELFTFKTFRTSVTPRFNKSTGAKVAFGAAAAGTDTPCTFAFVNTEVMRADGDVEPFVRYKDPEQRGDLLGFQKRFIALPLRSKGLGSIYSPA